jgi:hypothetical protein
LQFRFGGLTSQNITSYNGSASNVYCAQQPIEKLDPSICYASCTDRWGYSFVDEHSMQNYSDDTAQKVIDKCEALYQEWKAKPEDITSDSK